MGFSKTGFVAALVLTCEGVGAADRTFVDYNETATVSSGISNQDWTGAYPNGDTGGAVENYGTITIDGGLSFTGNRAASGGAVYSSSSAAGGYLPSTTTIGNGVSFLNNYTTTDSGGAVYVMGVDTASTLTIGSGATFSKNTAGAADYGGGGALYLQDVVASIGDNASFTGNKGRSGGAVFGYEFSTTNSATNFGSGATFTNNSATGNGGAVANFYSDFTFATGAAFSGNTATLDGGAIYNAESSTMTFNGDVSFSNNKAGGVLNDIYNAGALGFMGGGSITLDGGIKGASGSSITFDANTTLNAKLMMTPTITADTITIGSGGTIENLVIGSGVSGNNLELWEIANATGMFTYTGGDNAMFYISQNPDGTFDVSVKSWAVPGSNPNQVAVLEGLMAGTSANADFNTIADNIAALIQSGNPKQIAAGLAAAEALAPPSTPQAQAASTQNATQVFDAVGTRFTGGNISSLGQSSGDFAAGRGAFWIQGLTGDTRLRGTDGFKSNSQGFAAGIEAYTTSSTKLGVGYAYTDTNINPDIGETKIKSNTALLYGEYKPSQWFANATGSFTLGEHSNERDIAGVPVSGGYNTCAFAAQGLTGIELRSEDFIATPQAGFRYINVRQTSYVDSTGSYIDGTDSDYLTGVAGMKFSYEYQGSVHRSGHRYVRSSNRIRPEIYLGASYDVMTSDINASMMMANGSVVEVSGSPLHRAAFEGGAGLTIMSDFVDFTVGYIGRFRESYTDNTGLVALKYKF